MDEFEEWAKTIPWMDKPPSYSMFFDPRCRRDDAKKNALIASLRLTPQEGLAVLTRDAEKYRKDMDEFASKFMGPGGDVLFRCGAGNGLCIDAYGLAQPCMGVRAPELTCDCGRGNGHRPLREALDRFSRLRDLRATNPEYCGAAPAASSRDSASSARPSPGQSMERWIRPWSTSVMWPTPRPAGWVGWGRMSMRGKRPHRKNMLKERVE